MKIIKIAISLSLLGLIVAVLAANYNLSAILTDTRSLSFPAIATAIVALCANALFAALRFQTLTAGVDRPIGFRRAMAAVSAGSLAGAIFFQIAGQLIARGAILGRSGLTFASVIVITAYERIVAAVTSALMAIGGAYFIFGRIYLDQNAGGAELIKLICGLLLATAVAALIGYGRITVRATAATCALGASLFIGAYRFGWTDWAWINRFLGWFILLAYGATGALAVREGDREALKILALSFGGATIAIAGIEIFLTLLKAAGAGFSRTIIWPGNVSGFSQNHNFFAFQMLMATAAVVVFARDNLRKALLAILLTAFWFAGSRSGWIALVFVLATAVWLDVIAWRSVFIAALFAFGIALLSLGLEPQIIPSDSSTNERMLTIVGGFKLFLQHPFFGAGLGAFRNENILADSGIPLVIHSTGLWLLAELGITGFLIFVGPALHIFRTEWPRARKHSSSAVLILCLVAFAIMGTPADMMYQRTFWLLLGAALAVIPTVPASEISPSDGPSQRPESRVELQPS